MFLSLVNNLLNFQISCRLRLNYSREDWGANGQPDSKGGLIGGQILVRVDLIGPIEAALANANMANGHAR